LATELNINIQHPNNERIAELKEYIFNNAHQLKHVYMAGGEPLLMKENLELLAILKEKNPTVNLRVNTNLSKVDTRVFETICEFPNVHWTVSIDELGDEFEYVRYGSNWQDFLDNLETIRKFDHKISFNMLHHILNYMSIFDSIRFLQNLGFHSNSFIVGPLLAPAYLNVRHLPDHMLYTIQQEWLST
jgi:MoaA/NifB/PqqE/SkfB family radical SAM enzyme